MWHEARKQERKIRGMLVDYRKRAERRQDFYEKIKADPTQFMQIHGRRCKIHLDQAIAAAGESPAIMMPWQGQHDNLIDRFDVRAHLDYIPPIVKSKEPEEINQDERHCNYESYRILAQNDFLGISEEKYLHQLHLEEQFGVGAHQLDIDKPKKKCSGGVAIGYTYEDDFADPINSSFSLNSNTPNVATNATANEDDSDSDIDVDVSIDISKIDTAQAHELNGCGRHYGMMSNDFYSFLTKDADEAESLRMAREEEQEKIMLCGRKSRRERRAQREKRIAGRAISPPSYAAKEELIVANNDDKNDSDSRSPTPENSGKITYITSFGGEEELTAHSKISINFNKSAKGTTASEGSTEMGGNSGINTITITGEPVSYADKVKQNLEKLKHLNDSPKSPRKPLAYQRRDYSRSRSHSRTRSSYSHRRNYSARNRYHRHSRGPRSISRRRRTSYHSRSESRNRRYKYRQRTRSISSSLSSSSSSSLDGKRRDRRRSLSSKSSSSSTSSASSSSKSSSSSSSRSRSRSKSNGRQKVESKKIDSNVKSRSRSKSRQPIVVQRIPQQQQQQQQLSNDSTKPVETTLATKLTLMQNQITSLSTLHSAPITTAPPSTPSMPTSIAPEPLVREEPKLPEVQVPIKKYYGRKRDNQSSSSEDDMNYGDDGPLDKTNSDTKPSSSSSLAKSSNLGKAATIHTKTSTSLSSNNTSKSSILNPRDRLKKKMQILLNKQYKADKLAEIEKNERQIQQQQEREDEMRELALRLRRRQRELRHKYGSPSGSQSGDSEKNSDGAEGNGNALTAQNNKQTADNDRGKGSRNASTTYRSRSRSAKRSRSRSLDSRRRRRNSRSRDRDVGRSTRDDRNRKESQRSRGSRSRSRSNHRQGHRSDANYSRSSNNSSRYRSRERNRMSPTRDSNHHNSRQQSPSERGRRNDRSNNSRKLVDY